MVDLVLSLMDDSIECWSIDASSAEATIAKSLLQRTDSTNHNGHLYRSDYYRGEQMMGGYSYVDRWSGDGYRPKDHEKWKRGTMGRYVKLV